MDNPFMSFLGDNPRADYFSNQNQWQSPNAKKYYQNQFGNIQDQYMGQLGQWIKAGSVGQDPRFSDFLSNFNWGQNFQQNAPGQQGQNQSLYNPFTRWTL